MVTKWLQNEKKGFDRNRKPLISIVRQEGSNHRPTD